MIYIFFFSLEGNPYQHGSRWFLRMGRLWGIPDAVEFGGENRICLRSHLFVLDRHNQRKRERPSKRSRALRQQVEKQLKDIFVVRFHYIIYLHIPRFVIRRWC